MAEIQYPYALDENGALVNINQVDKDARHSHSYCCPCCKAPMVPRLGEVRAKCFAHAANDSCTKESYLHYAAKEIIAKKFASGSFPVRMRVDETCSTKCDCFDYFTCTRSTEREYDLAKYYDLQPEIETSLKIDDTIFRPDVTFRSSNEKHKPICIEIFYKHSCSEKKLELCDNVIEIRVKDFDDLIQLEKKPISESRDERGHDLVSFINFERELRSKPIVFAENKPYCSLSGKEKLEYDLWRSNCWKLYWYESGKFFVEKILESDKYKHQRTSVFEMTTEYEWSDAKNYLLGKVAEIFPKLRICNNCINFSRSEYGTTWCTMRRNGSSRYDTFDPYKAPQCNQFVSRTAKGPSVELWMQGDPDDKVELI